MSDVDPTIAAYESDLADEAAMQLLVGELRTEQHDVDAWLRRWSAPDA